MKKAIVSLLVAATTALAALADPPTILFTPGGVSLGGIAPGTKVAWLGMIRERVDNHTRVRFERGYGPATPAGKIEIAEKGASTAQAIWLVADASSGLARRSAAPGFVHSSADISIRAESGDRSIAIESAVVELLYVRPKKGAWSFGTGDGSDLDADAAANGVVTMLLSDLRDLQGNPHPPEQVKEGDLILVIDPYRIRTSQLVVSR
jgi:hypothetical protein